MPEEHDEKLQGCCLDSDSNNRQRFLTSLHHALNNCDFVADKD
jgi:hypothetical protein